MSKRSRQRNKKHPPKGTIVPEQQPNPVSLPEGQLGSLLGLAVSESYSGPIPPPQILRELDQLIPGAAKRILRMAEKQQEHRIALEKRVIISDVYKSWVGLILGGILGVLIVLCGSYVIHEGHDTARATIITTTLIGVVTAFVQGAKARKEERQAKEPSKKQK